MEILRDSLANIVAWGRRAPRLTYRHHCIMMAPLVDGDPVSFNNRRVLYIRIPDKVVEEGGAGDVKRAKGKIVDIESLGRLTTPLEGNTKVVRGWVEEALNGGDDLSWEGIVNAIRAHIRDSGKTKPSEETVEMDIYAAAIVGAMRDEVFDFGEPRSW
jgi:hypothetical protein